MSGYADETLARARRVFAARCGRAPVWGGVAPGRVNLIGEHTDYNGGFVLPIAIDRVCVAVGAPAADAAVSRVYAADLDVEGRLDLRRAVVVGEGENAVKRGSPMSYVAGVMAKFQGRLAAAGRGLENLDVVVASSVPLGSGLSSSASVEVAAATLLERAAGLSLEPKEKALLCQVAEHEFAGVPCGIMDQFISVMGRADHALLIDCRSQEAAAIPMPGGDRAAVMVINTGVHHSLAAGEYGRRRATCAAAAARLGVMELRDADMGLVARLSGEELKRARHVVTENARTLEAAERLRAGDLSGLGRLMRESHASLRDDYEVSCPELDTVVELALGSPGVYGARMTGGGFGGCAVALAMPGAVEGIGRVVSEGYRTRHGRECGVLVTRASAGARGV